MRAGVQKDKTIGSHWLHLPREMQNICQVSAGRNVIMAIDDKGDISKNFQIFLIFLTRWTHPMTILDFLFYLLGVIEIPIYIDFFYIPLVEFKRGYLI